LGAVLEDKFVLVSTGIDCIGGHQRRFARRSCDCAAAENELAIGRVRVTRPDAGPNSPAVQRVCALAGIAETERPRPQSYPEPTRPGGAMTASSRAHPRGAPAPPRTRPRVSPATPRPR
jgi:hypothetical protein